MPGPTNPMEDLITETIFTGTIVIFMLLTLSYLVFKRKNRFEKLQTELARKRNLQGKGHKSFQDLQKSTEVSSFFRTLSRSAKSASFHSNKSGLAKKANELKQRNKESSKPLLDNDSKSSDKKIISSEEESKQNGMSTEKEGVKKRDKLLQQYGFRPTPSQLNAGDIVEEI